MMTVTSLPARAASTSASTTGDCGPVRYSVCLIASTSGSLRGLAQEIDDRRERFERVMQQQLAFAHDREDVFLGDEPLRNARRERRIFQVRPIDQIVDRHQPIQIHRTVDLIQIVAASARNDAAGSW